MAKFRGLTAEQHKARRLLQNAINRTNRLLETVGHMNETYQRQASILSELGITQTGGVFEYNAKEADKAKGNIKQLERFKTARQEQQRLFKKAKEAGIIDVPETVTQFQELTGAEKEDILNFGVESYDMHEWINANLSAIYEYETINGRIVSGRSRPSWRELLTMRREIEGESYTWASDDLPFD